MECIHNNRSRYTHGFHCEDCNTFFPKNSSTYRSGELLRSLWIVLHNINVLRYGKNLPEDIEVTEMKNKIGIKLEHIDYEGIISEAEKIISKYGKNAESATIILDD